MMPPRGASWAMLEGLRAPWACAVMDSQAANGLQRYPKIGTRLQYRSAARAPGRCALRWGQGTRAAPLSPHPFLQLAAPILRFATDRFSLDEAEHFTAQSSCQRRYAPDGVRDHPGMPFGFASE